MNIQKNGINLLLVAEALLLVVVLVLGVVSGATGMMKNLTGDTEDNKVSISTENNGNSSETDNGSESQNPNDTSNGGTENTGYVIPEDYTEGRVTFSDSVEAKLASMTVEQKVAQLFLVTPEELTGYNKVTAFGNASKEALNRYPVGGFVYTANSFQNAAQTQSLLKLAKAYSLSEFGMTLFTAVEEEGGEQYSPLANALGHNRGSLASEIGAQGSASAVEQATQSRVNYVKADEFNLLLSTVADVSSALDTGYRLRTFGTDALMVSQLVDADIRTIEKSGVYSTLKYFPGKANASANGSGVLTSNETLEELSKGSLLAFQSGIDAGATFVMIGNVIVPSITDDENVPCCLSNRTVGLLRQEMGFE
ncbi:MAG: hypothetical protein IJ419_16610, partial [Agathobacter sp.]|nr:hypothetical protein [Agathobacter sp.]